MALPPPAANQAYCKVSALEGGHVQGLPISAFVTPEPGGLMNCPSLCFLLRHSTRADTLVFDLGVHADWAAHSPELLAQMRTISAIMSVPQDVAASLRAGGLDPADVTHVCLSHVHIDHVGDPAPFTRAAFLVGGGTRALPDPSSGHTQAFSNRTFAEIPRERVRFLDAEGWPALGPFPQALDLYGDGSVYVVDAPGHLVGHVNLLARTSPDGGWIYLAGDSAHDWRLITGEGKVARGPMCAHMDADKAEEHIGRIAKLKEVNKRARVLLAHDVPWYEDNKGGNAFWPGEIPSL